VSACLTVPAPVDETNVHQSRLLVSQFGIRPGPAVKHWATIAGRFGNSNSRFATTLLGVTQLFTPQLLVLLEATAVD
jgi:hypothetical protein